MLPSFLIELVGLWFILGMILGVDDSDLSLSALWLLKNVETESKKRTVGAVYLTSAYITLPSIKIRTFSLMSA